jgi:hypothetical protein
MNRCISEILEYGIFESHTLTSTFALSSSSSSSLSTSSSTSVSGRKEVISFASTMLIRSLLALSSTYYHDPRQDGSEAAHGQAIRSPEFARLFGLMFQNSDILPVKIMAPCYSIVTDVLNNDSSPPGILKHMLGNSIAFYALTGMRKSKEFSGESILSMANLISAISLTQEGIDLVVANNPFPTMFSIFHEPKYLELDVATVTPDISGALGGSVEELLRHHPSHMSMCIQSIVAELRHVVENANDDLKVSKFDETASLAFIRHMNFATMALTFVEPILNKKQPTTEFISAGGVPVLFELLNYALGPSRFLMTSLSCTTDPVPNTLGYFPVLNSVSHCLEYIAEHETEAFLELLIEEMNICHTKLELSMLEYFNFIKSTDSSSLSGAVCGIDVNSRNPSSFEHMFAILNKEEVSRSFFEQSQLSDHLERFSGFARQFVKYAYLVNTFSATLTPITSQQLPFLHQARKEIVEKLNIFDLLKNIIGNVYNSSQDELCRARCEVIPQELPSGVAPPIVYKIMVIARDGAVVRQSTEDSSKKVCKLQYLEVFYSSRRVLNSDDVYRYQMEDGWVGIFRGSNYVEPQLQIIDVIQNNGEIPSISGESVLQEKSSTITVRQGGLSAFTFFHNAVR